MNGTSDSGSDSDSDSSTGTDPAGGDDMGWDGMCVGAFAVEMRTVNCEMRMSQGEWQCACSCSC